MGLWRNPGQLRRAVFHAPAALRATRDATSGPAYPLSPDDVDDAMLRKTLEEVGLGHLLDRLDEEATWVHVLSTGEKQRLGLPACSFNVQQRS